MADDDKKVNVTSFFQSGGITAHTVHQTVNLGPQQRRLDSAWGVPLKAQILKDLPRAKPIVVMSMLGDAETYRLGQEIHAYLKSNGFTMAEDGISQGVFNPPPRGLEVDNKGEQLIFIVGPAN